MYSFACEEFGPSPENKKANILVEYERLVKKYGRCKRRTFRDCLRKLAKHISKKDKCQLFTGVCDRKEK